MDYVGRAFYSSWRSLNSNKLVRWLRLWWLASVLWLELGTFYYSLVSCRWPDKELFQAVTPPAHVLLVTDPQVHPLLLQQSYATQAQQWLSHMSLRKSWWFASGMHPDVVIFLGDTLASGSLLEDEEFDIAHRIFRDIFSLDGPNYYLPGNNDVGLNINPAQAQRARSRYFKYFGPFNQGISINNNTLLLLDAPAIVEEDYQLTADGATYDTWPPNQGGTIEFVKTYERISDAQNIILFTHIPLARPESASCGPLRERGTIRRGVVGPGYQSTLGKKTTMFLLEAFQPSVVFSGDDRDYCEYTHVAPVSSSGIERPSVREVTVKSFSSAKFVNRPGFHLLSLGLPSATHNVTHSDLPCVLPPHRAAYRARYPPFLILTSVFLVGLHFRRSRSSLASTAYLPLTRRGNTHMSWSPTSPVPKRSRSPRRPLPLLRTPTSGGSFPPDTPTFRASTHGHGVLFPSFFSGGVDGCEDTEERFYTYESVDEHDLEHYEPTNAMRTGPRRPTISLMVGERARPKTYSWTFTLGGRRRRVVLPSWCNASEGRPRFPMQAFLRDLVSVLWPAVVAWYGITWFTT